MPETRGATVANNYKLDASTQAMMAGQFRAEKNADVSAPQDEPAPNWTRNSSLSTPEASLREEAISEKTELEESKKEASSKLKEGALEKAAAPMKKATSMLLKQAWLASLETLGASLLYVNLHIFLSLIFGKKFFCSLGEEWVPNEAREMAGAFGKSGSKMIGLFEIMALFLFNMVLFIIFIIGLVVVYLLVDIIKHPIDAIWTYGLKPILNVISLYLKLR